MGRDMETVWLADELDERDVERPAMITGRRFDGVRLAGPALVHLHNVTMDDCVIEAPLVSLETVFFEVPPGSLVGCCVGIQDTEIIGCALRLIGFIGTAEEIAYFKHSLFGEEWDRR